jgi:hypothetical protein
MSGRYVIGYFTKEAPLLKAVKALRADGWRVHDVFTPYPVPGMDEALGLEHSWLGWVAFIGGMGGALGMMGTAIYVAVYAWPVDIGGRPMASIPAFFPPTFEAGVLAAALLTVGALLGLTRLFPGQEPDFAMPSVTDDRFAVVLDGGQAPNAGPKIAAALKAKGAVEIDEQDMAEKNFEVRL